MAEAHLLPTPLQSPSIPVWVAGVWPHRKPLRRAARFDGIYIGSEKANGEPLTPDDLTEALVYLRSQRVATSPFEVVFAGTTPADAEQGAELVAPYAAAGVTWWLEGIWNERGTFDDMKARIRRGPPRMG
jgi:alkanesulfonate monooxygenase SsuD/methylene tetrahydromethanopterin reductase-like flavin-dependent oxidoreductase (luciferase family)